MVGAHLEIKHFRMLKMIHQTGNMTQAAGRLFITQSALSQQLKDIEVRLGTDLFYRTGRKMVLTAVGRKLLKRAERILDQVEQAHVDIDKAVNGEKGELRIGVRCLFCYMWLPRAIRTFQADYPNVDIDIRSSADPEADLVSEKIDIAISAARNFDPRIGFSELFSDKVLVTMSENSRFRFKRAMELEDFHGADIISMVEKQRHYFFCALLKNKRIRPRRYMTVSHPEVLVDLIAADLGIGILPKWFADFHLAKKKLVTCPLTAKGTVLNWRASFLKGRQLPGYLKTFVRIISDKAIA